jgi:hypothetical protein
MTDRRKHDGVSEPEAPCANCGRALEEHVKAHPTDADAIRAGQPVLICPRNVYQPEQ